MQSNLGIYFISDLCNIVDEYMGFQQQQLFLQEFKQDVIDLPNIVIVLT